MRTTGFSSTRPSSWAHLVPNEPQPRRWVAVGEKEHYDTTSPADYREYLTAKQQSR